MLAVLTTVWKQAIFLQQSQIENVSLGIYVVSLLVQGQRLKGRERHLKLLI